MERKSEGANHKPLTQLRKYSRHLSLRITKSTIISSGCIVAVFSVRNSGEGEGEEEDEGVGDGEGEGAGEEDEELDEHRRNSSISTSKKSAIRHSILQY